MSKRIQLSRNIDSDERVGLRKIEMNLSPPHSVILELSDIIDSITQTHLNRLEVFNRNYLHLNKKYQETKELLKKVKGSASS